MTFKTFGFFREYYIGTKYIGSVVCEKDREKLGYFGRTNVVLKEDITLDNKRKLKAGTVVTTQLQQLCGKTI